jgi:hypothetical protein
MAKRMLTILLALYPLVQAAGDIAPRPIQAKGLISLDPVNVRLVRERVVVDLYKDSSVVECMFVLKNEGKAHILNIGFPEMNFYHSRPVPGKVPENFFVFENDESVGRIELYRPDMQESFSITAKTADNSSPEFSFSPSASPDAKPWLLWDSQFEENETKIVTVRYSLPFGVERQRCRYFNYLLSTGAGWKGNIEHAEIVVNLKDIDYDLVLKTTPAGFTADRNKLIWIMTDFEPTTDHDIKIFYEPVKGDYERMLALYPDHAYFIDGVKVWDGGLFDDKSLNPFRRMNPDDILSISIPKGSQKEFYGYESVIVIATKNYAIDTFVGRVMSEKTGIKHLRSLPHSEFIERYDLEIDGMHFENKKMLEKLPQIDFTDIMKLKSKKSDDGRVTIMIQTNKKR